MHMQYIYEYIDNHHNRESYVAQVKQRWMNKAIDYANFFFFQLGSDIQLVILCKTSALLSWLLNDTDIVLNCCKKNDH